MYGYSALSWAREADISRDRVETRPLPGAQVRNAPLVPRARINVRIRTLARLLKVTKPLQIIFGLLENFLEALNAYALRVCKGSTNFRNIKAIGTHFQGAMAPETFTPPFHVRTLGATV